MDWPRMRNRNGLGVRKMEGDPYGPYSEQAQRMLNATETGMGTRSVLIGEMNRLEQSMMGVYSNCGDQEAQKASRATDLEKWQVKRVFRWFLGLPEPECVSCEEAVARGGDSVYQRCAKHMGLIEAVEPPTGPQSVQDAARSIVADVYGSWENGTNEARWTAQRHAYLALGYEV